MEVTIRMECLGDPNSKDDIADIPKNIEIDDIPKNNLLWKPVCISKFTMVAKDPITGKTVKVPPLSIKNLKEQEIFNEGKGIRSIDFIENKSIRLEAVKKDLTISKQET